MYQESFGSTSVLWVYQCPVGLPVSFGSTSVLGVYRCPLLEFFVSCCGLLLQYLVQSCARGRRRTVEDMCYEVGQTEGCVDLSDHHTLVNTGGISCERRVERRRGAREGACISC
jgi:hypothetical protein